MLSHYRQVLDELREKTKKLASKYITELYFILREEEHLSHEVSRAKIESDCSGIWSEDTIRKYLPPEAKDKTKRKAGKISAEVKKRKKAKEANIEKEEEEAKPLIVNSGMYDSGSSSQTSVLIDGRGGCRDTSGDDNNDNSVGMNPTENGSIGQKKQESCTFQKMKNNPDSGNFLDEDPFPLPLVERLKDEALHEFEDRIPIEGFKKDLAPQVEVDRQRIRVLEKQVNDLEDDLRHKHSQLDQLNKENVMSEKRCTQLQCALDSYKSKIIKGTTQIEFGSELLPVKIEYNFTTCQFSARIPEEVIEQLLRAIRRHG